LYPKVRFRGFDEPWKNKKFLTFSSKITKNSTSDDIDFPRIEFENIVSGEGKLAQNRSKLNHIKSGIKFDKGDILFGKLRPYLKNWWLAEFPGVAVGDFWVIRAKDNRYFLYYLIQAPLFEKVSNYTTGTKMPRSDWNYVSNTFFKLPKIDEQEKIGRILDKVDSLLSLQQRKLELEKQLKFFLFQNAIPSKEAVIFKPKIRFREFQDKWKYAKLSEIYNTDCSGGTPSVKNKTFYGGNIPFLTISDLNNKKIYKTQKTLSKKGLENSSAKLVPAGSISLAMYASVGKIGILSKEMATSQAFFNMTFDDDEKRDFIYIILEKANFDKEWIRLISTGTQNNLNAKKIRNFHIVFPTYKALKGLNKLFCNIDTDIDIQYKVIVTTNQLKQFLLQNLFI